MLIIFNNILSKYRNFIFGDKDPDTETTDTVWEQLSVTVWQSRRHKWVKRFSNIVNWESNLSDSFDRVYYTNWN